jgi:HEAT repeat protein
VLPFLADMATSKDAVVRYVGIQLYLDALRTGLTAPSADIERILAIYLREPYPEIKERMTTFLGETKAKAAVDVLLEQVRRVGDQESVNALGHIGDARAVPVLIEKFRTLNAKRVDYATRPYISALGELKTPEAIDFLIEHLSFWDAPEALFETGSAKALPALEAHLQKMQKQTRDRDRANLAATRIAIIRLKDRQPATTLLALAEDVEEEEQVRRDAIKVLPNYRLEPLHSRLLALYNREKDHFIRWNCIELLTESKLDQVTAAFKRDLISPRNEAAEWEETGVQESLMTALNKRMGTSFRKVEEMRAFLLKAPPVPAPSR